MPSPTKNHLLRSLPQEEYERLLPHLESVSLPFREVLFDAEEPIGYVYFPDSGLVSIVSLMRDGSTVEVGVVGNEGMLGIPLVLGVARARNRRAVVHVSGSGVRAPAGVFRREFLNAGPAHKLLLRYTYAQMAQISQIAACNRCHNVKRRLARCLLGCQDRVAGDTLPLTQEIIAIMLGIRRAGVSEACKYLEDEGLIRGVRGNVTILNREGLESAACECYKIIKEEFDSLCD